MSATSRDFRACEATQSQSSIATRSEVRDGMRIDWDAAIPIDDGIVAGKLRRPALVSIILAAHRKRNAVAGRHHDAVKHSLTGVGPFLHTDPRDRPPSIFAGTNALHFSRERRPFLLLPVIPPK